MARIVIYFAETSRVVCIVCQLGMWRVEVQTGGAEEKNKVQARYIELYSEIPFRVLYFFCRLLRREESCCCFPCFVVGFSLSICSLYCFAGFRRLNKGRQEGCLQVVLLRVLDDEIMGVAEGAICGSAPVSSVTHYHILRSSSYVQSVTPPWRGVSEEYYDLTNTQVIRIR